ADADAAVIQVVDVVVQDLHARAAADEDAHRLAEAVAAVVDVVVGDDDAAAAAGELAPPADLVGPAALVEHGVEYLHAARREIAQLAPRDGAIDAAVDHLHAVRAHVFEGAAVDHTTLGAVHRDRPRHVAGRLGRRLAGGLV